MNEKTEAVEPPATRAVTTTSGALNRSTEVSTELAVSSQVATARAEIEGAMIIAKQFPRNEEEKYGRIIKACQRPSFAAQVVFVYPRGGKEIKGLSVYFAREAARIWGNIWFGFSIVHDDISHRTIRGFAWDAETNSRVMYDDTFEKLIQRKKKGGDTEWITPDERDLRELTNNRAARLYRNCVLSLLPEDFKRDAMGEAERVCEKQMDDELDTRKKLCIKAFASENVSVHDLETLLGHPLANVTRDEINNLQKLYRALVDGETTWQKILEQGKEPREPQQKSDELANQLETETAPVAPMPEDSLVLK